jgi:hypothetical protein
MPSLIIGNPLLSGPQTIVSGNIWSGTRGFPNFAGVSLRWAGGSANNNSGICYVFLSGGGVPVSSGGPTVNSGGMLLSGEAILDGMPMFPFDSYWIPAILAGPSGNCQISAIADTLGSGGRLYWQPDTSYKR